MNNIFTLTKILLKNNLISSISSKSKKTKSDKSALVYLFVIVIYFLIFSIPIISLLRNVLTQYDFSELILSVALPIGAITAMIFAIFTVASVFYFNKDSEQLLPLPIKSSELLISKFLTSLVSEYFVLFMFIVPIIFGVGIGINASVLYYVYATVICILMPIIPSVIVTILIMLVNKLINIGKRKNLFMYSMIALILVFSLGYGLGIGHVMGMENQEFVNLLMNGENYGVMDSMKYIFPFFNSATYSLIYYQDFIGFASFISFVGLNLLFMVILYFLGDLLYIKGLTKNNGTKKEKKESLETVKMENGGILKFLIKKEYKQIVRTPIYMLNIIIVSLLMPVIFLITFAISGGENLNAGLPSFIDLNNGGVYLIVIAIVFFMSTFGGTTGSSSGISREGKAASFMKSIPISLKVQLDAKVYFATILDMIVALLLEIPMIIMFKISWIYLVLINIPLIFLLLIINYICILLDLRKPKLTWSDESEAVKQNFTVMIGIMISMCIIALLALIGIWLMNVNVNAYLVSLLFTGVTIMCYILLAVYIEKNQVKLFNKVG